jgi:hypothetical protein
MPPCIYITVIGAGIVKYSYTTTTIKPLALASGHGHYIAATATPERAFVFVRGGAASFRYFNS